MRLHLWIRRLGLQTYDFTVIWGKDIEADTEASIAIHDDYEEVTLCYGTGWNKWSERKFDEVTVHELLHVVLNDTKIAVESVYDALSHDATAMLSRRYKHETEQAIEHLAQRIVDIERGQTR